MASELAGQSFTTKRSSYLPTFFSVDFSKLFLLNQLRIKSRSYASHYKLRLDDSQSKPNKIIQAYRVSCVVQRCPLSFTSPGINWVCQKSGTEEFCKIVEKLRRYFGWNVLNSQHWLWLQKKETFFLHLTLFCSFRSPKTVIPLADCRRRKSTLIHNGNVASTKIPIN